MPSRQHLTLCARMKGLCCWERVLVRFGPGRESFEYTKICIIIFRDFSGVPPTSYAGLGRGRGTGEGDRILILRSSSSPCGSMWSRRGDLQLQESHWRRVGGAAWSMELTAVTQPSVGTRCSIPSPHSDAELAGVSTAPKT